MLDRTMAIQTPCINICRIDGNGLCEGCSRSLDEIARWRAMSDTERHAIMELLPERAVQRAERSRSSSFAFRSNP